MARRCLRDVPVGFVLGQSKKKTGELSLTAVGDGKTVGHFQIVNVRRQPEFGGAKLNHSYPKRAVFLIRAPWKQAPCNRQQQGIL